MKQLIALCTLGVMCLLAAPIQAQNNYPLNLVSGNVQVASANTQSEIQLQLDRLVSFAAKRYCYLQFDLVPSKAEKEKMAQLGIQLGAYLPSHTFEATLSQSVIANDLVQLGIHSIIPVEGTWKMSRALSLSDAPHWAIMGDNKVRLNIQYDRYISPFQAINGLPSGVEVFDQYAFSSLLRVELDASQIDALAALSFLRYLEYIDPEGDPENYTGRTNHRTNVIASDYPLGRHYDGTGVIVALGDDGIIGPHIDYQGRDDQSAVFSNNGDHGDHVAGIIMSAGNLDPKGRGNAYGAELYVYDVWDAVNNTPSTYTNPGVRITSTSYGNGCNAGYNAFAQTADQQIRQMPSLMHVFSCGNSGTSDCGYGAGSGWGNITGGIKIGKNVIAVGNLNFTDGLSNSSSRGPAHDGRIKPDVCAVGSSVYSTVDVNDYDVKSGTSMACPGVSGTLAQLYHAYKTIYGVDPNSGLIKSTLMNTAEDLGNEGPDYEFGFGRVNAARAVRVLEDGRFLLDSLSTGGSNTHSITVPAGVAQLKVMVYWTDYEANANANTALVNDLDMTLTDPGSTIWDPWILDHTPVAANLSAPATRGVDHLNNMEQVTLDNPTAGIYTVDVSGFLIPQGPQQYYVVYEFLGSDVELTYPIGGEGLDPSDTEIIRWDAYGDTVPFSLDYSIDNGSSWNVIDNSISGTQRYYSWNVPNALSGECLVRVTRGVTTSESAANFSIIGVPQNLNVVWACVDSILIAYDSVPGATSYEISMLGTKYMDSLGTSTSTVFITTGLDPIPERWFSVKARGPLNAVGQRAVAVYKVGGTFNCTSPFNIAATVLNSPSSGTYYSCVDLDSTTVSVTLQNIGLSDASSIPVNYQLGNGPVNTETYAGPLSSGLTTTFDFTVPLDLSVVGNNTFKVWTEQVGDSDPFNDTVSANLEVILGAPVQLPYSENFESFLNCGTGNDCGQTVCNLANGWINMESGTQDDSDWRTDNNGTNSNGTGPDIDHNPGTAPGNYLYTEASGGCELAEHLMLSPCIDLSNIISPEFTFWYHMDGGDIGELHIDVFENGNWHLDVMTALVGEQSSSWMEATIDLTAFAGEIINIRFRGITGDGFAGDMAIDDVNIVETSTNAILETELNWNVNVFPNPSTGTFNLVVNNTELQNMRLDVSDLRGRIVYSNQNEFKSGKSELDLTHLDNGTYLLIVKTNNQQQVIKLNLVH